MNDRFRERLNYLSEEAYDGPLGRSVSPQGPRPSTSRRASRSPRPHLLDVRMPSPMLLQTAAVQAQQAVSAASHDSRPNIAAWPAPPATPGLSTITGRPVAVVATQQQYAAEASSPALSPNPSFTRYDDERENLVSLLRAAAASSESSNKLAGRESELKRKIQTLEDTVAEYEKQRGSVMTTFHEYKERVSEREKKLEAEYSTKIIALSEEVLGAKKDFEARMKSFQQLSDKFEREKEQALEKLRQEHQKEIQLLEQRFSESQLLNLEQKYMIEIQRLEEERKSLRSEKERLGETFEMKLRRAQSLYETELGAAKMLYSRELEALRDHEEALKEELLARQDEFHDRLQELQHQAKRSRDDLTSCKNEVTALEQKLHSKEAEVQQISQELEEARTETNEALRKLAQLETEMEKTHSHYTEQEEELRRKSAMLDQVDTAKQKLEMVIKDLQAEVKALKNKVDFLEKERHNLEGQSESQNQMQEQSQKALEALLASITKDKEETKDHYENLLTKERQQAETREHSMKKEFSSKLNELEEQYTSLKEELEHTARINKDELREATEGEIEALRAERRALVAEVGALKSKYIDGSLDKDEFDQRISDILEETRQLSECLEAQRERIMSKDDEIERLRAKVEEDNQCTEDQLMAIREEVKMELAAAGSSNEIDDLHAKIADLEVQLEKDEADLIEDGERIKALEDDNEKMRAELGASDSQADKRLREALHQKEKELQDQFEERVRGLIAEEKAKLPTEETGTWEEEKAKMAEELSEMKAASETKLLEMQHRCEALLEEMDGIKGELRKKNEQIENFGKSDEEIRNQDARKIAEMEEEASTSKKEHEAEIEAMKKEQEGFAARIAELEASLKEKEEYVPAAPERPATTSCDVQTDEMERPAPIAIVDLAKEKELRERILMLESTLEQKEAVIVDLHARIDEAMMEDMPKKKDRSASVGGEHTITCQKAASKFHNLVSSISSSDHSKKEKKEKEEEAKAAEKKKKEAEKMAAHAIKEKSPSIQRSKSPSLLTRLRERSPGKAKQSTMETTPSSSSRNLLSPTDAEVQHMERRSSPSRNLFGRSKKESSSTPSKPAWKI